MYLFSLSALFRCFIGLLFLSFVDLSWAWHGFPLSHPHAPPSNLWQAIREDFQLPKATNHPLIQQQIRWLLKHPDYFDHFASNARPYLYYVYHQVHERKLPGELALIPMIESAYDPFQYSKAGAAGLWQIMPGTGSGLGLQQDWWYDGRRDVPASTNAALNYFIYLNRFFDGDWQLSIAAYDSGEGTVQHAVEHNAKLNKPTDYWSLKLPTETRIYIPRLLALAEIVRRPNYYHLHLPPLPNTPYFSKVDIGFQVDLSAAASAANIKLTKLYQLNPGYNRWASGPNGPFHLLVPMEKIDLFRKNISTLSKQPTVNWLRHTVKPGDSLGKIAERYKTTVALLKAVNKLHSNTIHEGSPLLIPGATKRLEDTKFSHRQVITPKIARLGPNRISYQVRSGDSLAQIAKRFHVRVNAILYWNRLANKTNIKAGKELIIWTPLTSRQITRDAVVHYRVKRGDSLFSIAHKFHVRLNDLMRWNSKKKNKVLLHPGDHLVIHHKKSSAQI